MAKLIVVADMGHFKAYKLTHEIQESPHLELVSSIDNLGAHGKMSEKVTDGAGRFSESGAKGGAARGYGEPHSIETEGRKRGIELLAGEIGKLVKSEGVAIWHLAASKSINSQLVECLDEDAKAKLRKNLTSDLTNTPASELLAHFA